MDISIHELKANPARAIGPTRLGERVRITSHRKVVAEPAAQLWRLPMPVLPPPSPDGKTMSDLVIALRGPR